jgi:uncharacterized OB-fold protein
MSDDGLLAVECANGHVSHPGHPICTECGAERTGTVDLTGETGEIVTWTTSHATPPGVREPNPLAIVAFQVGEQTVRVLGGTTTTDVEMGDRVRAVYVEELRDPAAGIKVPESQAWDGYRFEPVD